MTNYAAAGQANGSKAALTELIRAARERIAALAVLNFCWFMILPGTVWLLSDSQFGAPLAVAAGVALEISRLLARQNARKKLRQASMSRAAEKALAEHSVTSEVLADSAFWGAHIVEYAASVDLPAIAGAALAVLVTLGLAATRTGISFVAEVGGVLLAAVALGVVSNRLRRPGVYTIVDRRERTAVWMAAAVRDRGELASPKANAAFLVALAKVVDAWCQAEDRVERARTRHRLVIAFGTGLALYAVARHHGFDATQTLRGGTTFGGGLSGIALLGSSLPAAYALAMHLDSMAIANSELSRLTLNQGEPKVGLGTRLVRAPRQLRVRSLTAHHGKHLALDLGDLELSLERPLGIAGPNGSGKTTLATLIAGLLSPSSGEVFLDETPARDVHRDDVAFVPQEPVLIEPLSVLENLQLVAPSCEPSRAVELLRSLGLNVALESLAGKLSRGEQRRIAIARALLKAPKLVVLDEPDAWLDSEGRRALLATLNAAAANTSVVIVSHRPDTLLNLETVLVLTAEHRAEGADAPDRLRVSSPTFRELLGEEPVDTGSFEAAGVGRRAR